MEQMHKDETRWLARVFAFFCIVLGYRTLTVLLKRVSEEHTLVPTMIVSLAALVFFFWLAYRLLTCSSVWNVFPWFSETFPAFQYFQSRYFSLNKHIRAGLIGGVILYILTAPLPFIFSRYKGVWFWELVKQVAYAILLPVFYLLHRLNSSGWPKEFCRIIFIIYIFAIGFLTGVLMSWFAEWLNGKRKYLSPKDLNNGSPGCSETEPGDEGNP